MLANLRTQLQSLIEQSVAELCASHQAPPVVVLETPSDKKHGELSCSTALRLAGILKKNPLDIATQLKDKIEKQILKSSFKDKIKTIKIKKPGFINFFLTKKAFYEILYQIFKEGDRYGRSVSGQKQKIQIEFVSANPTGPLSVAHARQAAVGDALGNILMFLGYDVKKEYYINDEGNQVNLLGASIRIRAEEKFAKRPIPEILQDGYYQGEYIKDIADTFIDKYNIKYENELKDKKIESKIAKFGVNYLLDGIKKDLEDFQVHFDIWSSQSKIATPKNIEDMISQLRKKGFIEDKDGAVWFKSSNFGDDKDRVVKKSDGSYTYLAPDIVYHDNKYKRGFSKIINIWGPDHHGYIPRLKAAIQALGKSSESLEVLIVQLATIYREGKPVSMSTRRGQYISLREVIGEVGVDAARYFFLMRHINAHLDFDLELAKKQTPENPVYYIQYAHARIHSIVQFAANKIKPKRDRLELIDEEEEIDLIKKIGAFNDILEICHRQFDPYALTIYLLELATLFHKFYDRHRVVSDDINLSAERLALIEAVRIVLGNGLRLLGISTPTKM